MNITNLDNFLRMSFVTILAFGVILLTLKHWRGVEWLKIISVLLIALFLNDFATDQGGNFFVLVR